MKTAICMLSLVLFERSLCAQAPLANRAIGVVTAIEAGAKQITIRSAPGGEVRINLQDTTTYERVPPGEKDLKNAAKITLSDLAIGDRVLARGASASAGALTAASVVVMTQADLAKKHEADQAEWRKRGVSGVITALN